ncbi:MAG: hypothetical protein ACREXT_06470, partial [Gammaproteobacteria bacterium]
TLGCTAFMSMLCAPFAEAAVIAHFDFEDSLGNFSNLAELTPPQMTVGVWSDADGTLGSSTTGNPGFAVSATSFKEGNAYLLTLTPAAGFKLALTGFSFDHRISSTGPTNWNLQLNGLSLGTGTTSASFKTDNLAFTTSGERDPLLLRLAGGGASSNAGTWRLDNVTISGNLAAVPLPASLWLLLAGCLRLAQSTRRQISVCASRPAPEVAIT